MTLTLHNYPASILLPPHWRNKSLLIFVFLAFFSLPSTSFSLEPSLILATGGWCGESDNSEWWGIFGTIDLYNYNPTKPYSSIGLLLATDYGQGSSKLNTYEWTQWSIGAGPSYRLSNHSETFGNLYFQIKGRVDYVYIWAQDALSNYEKHEDAVALYGYSELSWGFSRSATAQLSIYGKTAVWNDFRSTYADDKATDLNYAEVDALLEMPIFSPVAIRGIVGGFYSGWSDEYGRSAGAEIKAYHILTIGIRKTWSEQEDTVSATLRIEAKEFWLADLL